MSAMSGCESMRRLAATRRTVIAMSETGFRGTESRRASRHGYAASGLCRMLRPGEDAEVRQRVVLNDLVDRMFGLDDSDDSQTDIVLRRAAKSICTACPVRLECLADATVNMVRHGIYGGLSLEERKSLARTAEADGIEVRDQSTARARGGAAHAIGSSDGRHCAEQSLDEARRRRDYTDWLKVHGEEIGRVKARESRDRSERRRREREAGKASLVGTTLF